MISYRKRLFGSAAIAVVMYLSSVFFLGNAGEMAGQGQLWSGYYTLLVPDRYGEAPVLDRLEAAGFTEVVTESRTTVRVTAFSHLERVPLSELDDRLEAEDPRFDPYMRRLPRYFRAEGIQNGYRLFYLPASGGIVGTAIRLRRAFPEEVEDWFLADFAGVHRWVAVFGVLAFSVVLTVLAKGRRLGTAAICIPWVLGSLSHGGVWPAYAASVSIGGYLLLTSLTRPKGLITVTGVGAILLPTILVLQLDAISPRSGAAALGATLSVVLLSWLLSRRRRVGKDHPLFAPLRILPRSPGEEGRRLRRLLPLLPGLLLLGGTLALLPLGRDIRVPSPAPLVEPVLEADAASAPGTLRELWTVSRGDELPNLSDFFAHVAYQEGFSFGAEFAFPSAAAPLTLVEIREEEGRLVEGTRIAADYGLEWIEETLDSVPSGSIERLLLQQPTSTGVVNTPLSGLYSRSSHLITYGVVLLVAYSPILIGVLIFRLRGARARGSRSTLGRLNNGLAPYVPERGNSSI